MVSVPCHPSEYLRASNGPKKTKTLAPRELGDRSFPGSASSQFMSEQELLLPNDGWSALIETCLGRLTDFVKSTTWFGRENEVVNLFAHRFLPAVMSPESPLSSLEQIGIEVAVAQVMPSRKQLVRKDLVLWSDASHNPWHPTNPPPAVVVEWKTERSQPSRNDIDWLCRFTERFPTTIGYAVSVRLKTEREVSWKKIEAGKVSTESLVKGGERPRLASN